MANVKRLEQLSGWVEYELETTLLDPPVLRLRLRPNDSYSLLEMQDKFGSPTRALLEAAIESVGAWDLTEGGTPIPIDDKKAAVLRPLMSEIVKGRGTPLGVAVYEDSSNRELFLKN